MKRLWLRYNKQMLGNKEKIVENHYQSNPQRNAVAKKTNIVKRSATFRTQSSLVAQKSRVPIIRKAIKEKETISVEQPRDVPSRLTSNLHQKSSTVRISTLVTQRKENDIRKLKEELDIEKRKNAELEDQLRTVKDELMNISIEHTKIRTYNDAITEELKIIKVEKQKALEEVLSWKENYERKELEIIKIIHKYEIQARKMHDELVNARGKIRICARIRPFLQFELANGLEHIKCVDNKTLQITHKVQSSGGPRVQTAVGKFQHVWLPDAGQAALFSDISDLIKSAINGFNVSVIAYGQTGSGKTYTLEGGNSDEDCGLIQRCLELLFSSAEELTASQWKVSFAVSHFEIYNNRCYDLLATNGRTLLDVHFVNSKVEIRGLTKIQLSSVTEGLQVLQLSKKLRSSAWTETSAQSSRSHAIFQILIETACTAEDRNYSSVLSLVDLAGSERVAESKTVGERFKETVCINSALSSLRNVIRGQLQGQKILQKPQYVPYRDNILTMVLADCLGAGNSKTLLIVTLKPNAEAAAESARSVEFANEASLVNIGSARKQAK